MIFISYFFLGDDEVALKTYEASHSGFVTSWVDRFAKTNVHEILEEIWTDNKKYFPDITA